MFERLEKLDGSKRPRAIVLNTMPGGDDDQVETGGFVIMTAEEWEEEFCKPDHEGEATARGHK
jgi:hypothetical protein